MQDSRQSISSSRRGPAGFLRGGGTAGAICFAFGYLILSPPSSAQVDLPLRNIYKVAVSVNWNGSASPELQAEIENRLAQIGLKTADPKTNDASIVPILFIGIGQGKSHVPVLVQLSEKVYTMRGIAARMGPPVKVDELVRWRSEERAAGRAVDEGAYTTALNKASREHYEEASRIPADKLLQNPIYAATWEKWGMAQVADTESVSQITARYLRDMINGAPNNRQFRQKMMELESQEALIRAQEPVPIQTVKATVNAYIDMFIKDWTASNR